MGGSMDKLDKLEEDMEEIKNRTARVEIALGIRCATPADIMAVCLDIEKHGAEYLQEVFEYAKDVLDGIDPKQKGEPCKVLQFPML
jgi:hypothetical protein